MDNLPGNIVGIIKNALIVYEGNTKKVANLYKLDKEKIDLILEENYLQLSQIIYSKMSSQELDTGIDDAISLMANHVSAIKSKNPTLLRDSEVNQVNRIADRMLGLKKEFNNTFDTLVNKMNEQNMKLRQLQVLENGKPEDNSEYFENQNTVINMLKKYGSKKEKKIIIVNIKTYETKTFTNYKDADEFIGAGGHLRDIAARKTPYKETWLVNMDEYYDKE